jgi:hypothetical protein
MVCGAVLAGVLATAALLWAAPGSADSTATSWSPDVAAARHYAKHRRTPVSFEIIDLAGRASGFRATRTYPMASTIKVMLLLAYLDRPSVRNRRLHHSEKALLGPMIRRSSNNAATRVLGIVGSGALYRVAHRAHMHRFHFNSTWGLSRTDPLDQARFMLHIDQLLPARHRDYGLYLLSHVIRPERWGIGRVQLPPGWNLYFKGGWGITSIVNHQVVLISSGDERLSLAIYTNDNPSPGYGQQTLRGVASRLLAGLPAPDATP